MGADTLRKQILEADDIGSRQVEVPEWEAIVEVRSMSGLGRARFLKQAQSNGQVDFERFYPELVIATTFDPETGHQVFEAADRDALNGKSSSALERIAQVAMELSGLSSDAVDEAEKSFE